MDLKFLVYPEVGLLVAPLEINECPVSAPILNCKALPEVFCTASLLLC